MGKVDLQLRRDLTKKRRHVTWHSLGRGRIKQTMSKALRIKLLPIWGIYGC